MRQYLVRLATLTVLCSYWGCVSQQTSATPLNVTDSGINDNCATQFWQGKKPKLISQSLSKKTHYLCFNGFALLYSGVSKTPLWVAEHLTKERMDDVRHMHRVDNFHEEPRIPASQRAYLKDYNRYIFDRGHMAPNGDMANPKQQFDSFSLANIIPQSPWNNREVWRNIEEATRVMARKESDIYVITGGAFLSEKIQKINRILVPSHVFKVVYFPSAHVAGAYLAPNDESNQIQVMSLFSLEQQIGINILPSLNDNEKRQYTMLPLTAKAATHFKINAVQDITP